ncbi:cell wall-binding repeat-containing protein [Romboutsia sedimentorum]|uniref:cell wall-binding repeat-containing protein n=1 Tax=Romboutsia sedimentorum TaxID=1368474 RepID=UPI0024DE0EAE|nr:cell wall-binding repeat-containing protein [Romboutsia sedimentorum]MDK2586352.1 cell wall-binding repeat-containing protein [Romboutsia sedimentorum]
MLKKKNIAMVMAAASVVTSVAPVFADVTKQDEVIRTEGIQAFVAEVEAKFAVKYSDVVENAANVRNTHAYAITVGGTKTIVDKIAVGNEATQMTLAQFKDLVNGMKNGQAVDVKIANQGHEVRDGKVYKSGIPQYTVDTLNSAVTALGTTKTINNKVYTIDSTKKVISDKEVQYTLNFKNDTTKEVEYTATLATGDKTLNFESAQIVNNKLAGFEKSDYVELANDPANDIEKRLSKSTESTVNASTLFDGVKLTQAGNELASSTFEGNNYATTDDNTDRLPVEAANKASLINVVKENEKYEMKLFITNKNLVKSISATKSLTKDGDLSEMTIESSSKAVLEALIEKLDAYAPQTEAGLISGVNRFETAVEVSKARFANTADSVVLVGENAVVDGLASGPLAAAKNAPILYSKKDSVHESTMKEINRLFPTVKNKTVYIVGGEDIISKTVENELANKGLNIVRLAGDTRVDTSLAIAKEIGTAAQADKAFVVGYNGEADAMSVSSIASYKDAGRVTPILVSDRSGLTEATKGYISKEGMNNLELVGGEDVLTANVKSQLDAMKKTSTRVQGERRQDTNAAVIEKYFNKDADGNDKVYADNVYVAKSDVLVDALVAAPLVSKDNTMQPIVLATKTLTEKQEIALEKVVQGTVDKTTLIQVGDGVLKTVMNKIAELIK